MKRIYAIIFFSILFFGCSCEYDTKTILSPSEYDSVLVKIAPYVVKKPDEFSFGDRFKISSRPFYKNFIDLSEARITYFFKNDSTQFFFFEHKDLTSLYEHYRGLGGYFKMDETGRVVLVNLLYHTPRLTREEMTERGYELFNEMVKRGNVAKFMGDTKYIDTPNNDFYYNVNLNRWDYTPNSSWKFLEKAKQEADSLSH